MLDGITRPLRAGLTDAAPATLIVLGWADRTVPSAAGRSVVRYVRREGGAFGSYGKEPPHSKVLGGVVLELLQNLPFWGTKDGAPFAAIVDLAPESFANHV